MSETVEFTIGAEVFCEEGTCGVLRRVVIDPIARAITHLVVDPQQGQNLGHLVPIDRVDTSKDEIRLRCTMAEFEALEDAEETQFLQGGSGQWGYGQGQTLLLPFFGLGMRGMGMGGMGMGMGGIGMRGQGMGPQAVTRDRVPVGEVEVRRGDHVYATDGPIGRVQGLVIDASDYHVTHVLLDEGHMWGKKEVSIPISAVIGVDDAVRLNLTKNEVRDLPPVDVGHHD